MNAGKPTKNTSSHRQCPVNAAARLAAKLAVLPYSAIMSIRRRLYRKGLRKSHRAGAPVICVGNITTGGTGKTPMVAWVVHQLAAAGRKPAILTRGYKSVAGRSDEAELLEKLTGAPIVVNADRVAGASHAVADGADVLVMDDGFQHLRIGRDLDIVLIDAMNPFGNRWSCCIPIGRLREPLFALKDADAIVITRTELVSPATIGRVRECIEKYAPQASIHLAAHAPVKLIDENGADLPPDALAGRKVFLFCGIGNPDAFAETVYNLNPIAKGKLVLADHAKYTQSLLDKISCLAGEHGAELLVTTQKDFVKLGGLLAALPIYQVVVEMRIVEGEAELLGDILAAAGVSPPS